MKFENTDVWGFEHALRGMRNPKNSWKQSDSKYDENAPYGYDIGPNDMRLAQALIKGGPEHRKFLRQIFVSVDITAPLYWWKEFDTYKVGTVANSTSTMHKLMSKPITRDSFEIDDFCEDLNVEKTDLKGTPSGYQSHWIMGEFVDDLIAHLEEIRKSYLRVQKEIKELGNTKRREERAYLLWKELVRWLPEGWLQTRTVTMNYENLLAMCSKSQRRFHKLNEWSGKEDEALANFIAWARTLPYAQQFIFIDELVTPGEMYGKAMKDICDKLLQAHHEDMKLSDYGIIVLNPDGTFKSVYAILRDLADKFDKNEIF